MLFAMVQTFVPATNKQTLNKMHTKPTFRHNRVFCKVRKTGHQYPEFGPEFGPKPGEIPKKKKPAKKKVH
jgi:hypothetical protein